MPTPENEAVQAARDLVLTYLPGADPVWLGGETHADRRIDVFHLPSPMDHELFVMSLRIDHCFVPDVVSTYPHVPYDTSAVDAKPPRGELLGVFVWTEPIHSKAATQARFAWGGKLRTAAVVAGHCLLIDWDTAWPRYETRPRPQALCIGGVWLPTVSSLVAATAADFATEYVAYYDKRRLDADRVDDWASQAFDEAGSFVEKVAMVECILNISGLHDFAHGCLAAGPVENLIGHDLLDYIEADAEARARWVPLLRKTYWSSEPPEVRRRLQELLG